MLEGPTSHIGYHSTRKDGMLAEVPKVISNKEDLMIFSDAPYKNVGNASFRFIMKFNNIILDSGAIQGPRVSSSNEAKTRWS